MHQVGDKQESKAPLYLRTELTELNSLPHLCLHLPTESQESCGSPVLGSVGVSPPSESS